MPATDQRARWGLGDAVLATVLGFVASAVAAGVALGVADVEDADELALWVLALVQVPLWLGLAGVPWWASRRKGTGSLRDDFGLWSTVRDVPVGLAVGLLSQLFLAHVGARVYDVLGIDTDEVGESARTLVDRADDPFGVVCLFLVVVVGAALFEELCYRGLWLRSFERRFGAVPAVVLSGLVFGAVHLDVYTFPLLALFGMVLAVLAVRTGRLGAAIWAHVAFNLSSLLWLLLT